MIEDTEVVVVGAGAAGIGASRALTEAGIGCLLLEARERVGGRALTSRGPDGAAMDLGCGWLHSATRNPWVSIAETLGFAVDRTRPPWARGATAADLLPQDYADFAKAQDELDARVATVRAQPEDRAVGDFLESGNRWNPLIDAVSGYYSGAETALVSATDLDRYDDGGVNWRVRQGYGRTIERYAAGLPVVLNCAATAIDHSGRQLRVETERGAVAADAAIVTLPSRLIAQGRMRFTPALPEKADAAAALPLGLADKLFLRLDGVDDLEPESRAFGRTDRTETATYHFRPFGRPQIECYFGGRLAADLERDGTAAFFDFAARELAGLFGGAFTARIAPLPMHLWRADPLSGGSYSYAVPGGADMRGRLAAPVDGRIFFAGEACSGADFSTAHGALLTGRDAARGVVAALRPRRSGEAAVPWRDRIEPRTR